MAGMRRPSVRRALALGSSAFVAFAFASGGAGSSRVLHVAYVADAGTIDASSPGRLMFEGFIRAVRQFHFDARVVQVAPRASWADALASFGKQRYDLIVGGTFIPAPVVASVARQFPRSRFLAPDPAFGAIQHPPKNLEQLVFRVEQAGYLAGYLAGLIEKRAPGRDVVSAVGGVPTPPVNRYIAGYAAGARKADPGIRVIIDYSHNFADPLKCRSPALSEIAKGSGVVFAVAGGCGIGALRAAGEHHVWGVGVDVDQATVGPQILTSVLKRDDVGLYRELKALSDKKLTTGGVAYLGLREGAVGLGKISPKIPRPFLHQLSTLAEQISAGTIVVPTAIS